MLLKQYRIMLMSPVLFRDPFGTYLAVAVDSFSSIFVSTA